MKTIAIILAATFALSGCAHVQTTPVIDSKGMTPERYTALRSDTQECEAIAKKASTDGAGMALWGVLAGDYRRADALKEKERIVKRECLRGRGWSVLY